MGAVSLAATALSQTPSIGTSPSAGPLSTQPAPVLSLAEVLRAARENSDVAFARQSLSAARADILAADHAPAPVLIAKSSSIDLQNGVGSGSAFNKRIDQSIGIDWTWERGGKRVARTTAAQRSADAAQAELDDIQVQQLVAAGGAFYDLLGAQEKLEEIAAIERSAVELGNTSARRVQAGDLPAQEGLRSEIETQRSRVETRTAELDRERARIALASLLGPATTVRLASANPTDWPAVADVPGASDLDALVENRADVRAAQSRVAAAEAQFTSAQALRSADVTLGVSVDRYPGVSNRLLEVRASVPLNWSYRFDGEIGRAQALLTQSQDQLEKTRLIARLDFQRLRAEAESQARRLASFDTDILTRSRKVADTAEMAYKKGAMSLTDLLDARRTLRATQLDAINARVDYAKAALAWRLRTQPLPTP